MWLPFLKQSPKKSKMKWWKLKIPISCLKSNFCHLFSKRRKVILGGGSTNLSSQESHLQCIKTWEPSMGKLNFKEKLWSSIVLGICCDIPWQCRTKKKQLIQWLNDWLMDGWIDCQTFEVQNHREFLFGKSPSPQSSGPVGQWASGPVGQWGMAWNIA